MDIQARTRPDNVFVVVRELFNAEGLSKRDSDTATLITLHDLMAW